MKDGETEGRRDHEPPPNPARKAVLRKHTDLDVYQRGFAAAMKFFELSKTFPVEERYSLTGQGRRASRSVCANLTEAWRKRRYPAAFVSKLTDAEGEAAETQTWIQFAISCGYLRQEDGLALEAEYDNILGMLVNMTRHPEDWQF